MSPMTFCMICYFWCTSSFQSMCYSNSGKDPSAKEIVYFKSDDKLDVHLNLTGIPRNAKQYNVWMFGAPSDGKLDRIPLKQDNIISTDYIITFYKYLSTHYKTSDIYIRFYTRKQELVCDYHLPFKLSAARTLSTASKHPCVSSGGCTCNFDMKCNNDKYPALPTPPTRPPPPPPPVTTTAQKNFHKITEYILTNGYQSNETEVIRESEGKNITLSCKSLNNDPNLFLKWTHKKVDLSFYAENGEIISELTGNYRDELNITLTLYLFDNNTELICNALDNSTNVFASSKINKVILYGSSDKINQTKVLKNSTISACLKQNITLHCHENKTLIHDLFWLEQRDSYTKKYNDKYSFEIKKEHVNSKFICFGFSYLEGNRLRKREIQRILTFNFSSNDKCQAVIPDNGQLLINGSVAGAGALGAVIILGALLFSFYRFHRKNQSNPHQVETYGNLRVQYADLAILGSVTTRTVQREESPYAEIIGFMEPKTK